MLYCTESGCSAKVARGRCADHTRNYHRADRWGRGTSAQRGYDSTWRNIRNAKLLADPLCEPCERDGRVTVATEVDHITPLVDGGTHDRSNLQAICRKCHAIKTARERNV